MRKQQPGYWPRVIAISAPLLAAVYVVLAFIRPSPVGSLFIAGVFAAIGLIALLFVLRAKRRAAAAKVDELGARNHLS